MDKNGSRHREAMVSQVAALESLNVHSLNHVSISKVAF